MENSEQRPLTLEDHKRGLIAAISKLEEGDIIKLAKAIKYARIEGSEEALKFVIQSIKDANDTDDFQALERKFFNLGEIKVE